METPNDWMEAGAWVGRQQAFAVIANKCTAAQALALKQMRESRFYETLGLNWETFCRDHAGISRAYADDLIRRLDEFGDSYFRLADIARISPEVYRGIATKVTPEGIEIDGESVPLTRANAGRIRAAIKRLRAELKQTNERLADRERLPTVLELLNRFDTFLAEAGRVCYEWPKNSPNRFDFGRELMPKVQAFLDWHCHPATNPLVPFSQHENQ